MKKRIALLSLIVVLCAGAIIAIKLMGDSTLHRMQMSKKSDELTVCNDKHSKQSPIIIKCLNKKDDYITETELEKI